MKDRYCGIRGDDVITYMPLNIPKIVYIEVSKKCNLYCNHCFNNSGPNGVLPEFDFFNDIRQQLKNISVKEVIISGGEPFARSDILEIIQLFSDDYNVKILTNGTMLKESDIVYLVNKKVKIQITLNGATKDIDSRMRGSGYDATVTSIKKIIELDGKELLYVTTAISKLNYRELEDYTDFLVELGVANIQFSMVNRRGRAVKNWDDLSLSLPEKVTSLLCIEQMKKKYSDHNFITSGLNRMNDYLVDKKKNDCEYFTEEICFTSDRGLSICPCISIFCECKNIEPTYSGIGTSRTKLEKIDYSECKCCKAYSSCMVGCLNNEEI